MIPPPPPPAPIADFLREIQSFQDGEPSLDPPAEEPMVEKSPLSKKERRKAKRRDAALEHTIEDPDATPDPAASHEVPPQFPGPDGPRADAIPPPPPPLIPPPPAALAPPPGIETDPVDKATDDADVVDRPAKRRGFFGRRRTAAPEPAAPTADEASAAELVGATEATAVDLEAAVAAAATEPIAEAGPSAQVDPEVEFGPEFAGEEPPERRGFLTRRGRGKKAQPPLSGEAGDPVTDLAAAVAAASTEGSVAPAIAEAAGVEAQPVVEAEAPVEPEQVEDAATVQPAVEPDVEVVEQPSDEASWPPPPPPPLPSSTATDQDLVPFADLFHDETAAPVGTTTEPDQVAELPPPPEDLPKAPRKGRKQKKREAAEAARLKEARRHQVPAEVAEFLDSGPQVVVPDEVAAPEVAPEEPRTRRRGKRQEARARKAAALQSEETATEVLVPEDPTALPDGWEPATRRGLFRRGDEEPEAGPLPLVTAPPLPERRKQVGTEERGRRRTAVRVGVIVGVLALAGTLPWVVPAVPEWLGSAVPEPTASPTVKDPEIKPSDAFVGPVGVVRLTAPYDGLQLASAGIPKEVDVPRLSVRSEVVPISGSTGELIPPDDPQILGYWQEGRSAGVPQGSVVVTGHTVQGGGGAFDNLGKLVPGDTIRVRTGQGWIRYRVTLSRVYSTAALAQRADEIFDQNGTGRLVLITCSDFNGEIYLSNSVVYAIPVEDSPFNGEPVPPNETSVPDGGPDA